ncbi:MAG: FMN-binding negative transcriptional regulator [Hyphomicrobiales bacterium]
MYQPPAFREDDRDALIAAMRCQPLGLLVSAGADGPIANLLPFEVVAEESAVTLKAHLARANSQWQGLDGETVLVAFQGVDAYVSPRWYASKAEHGKVVPTWNYVMVQARGRVRVIEDGGWLLDQVSRLTDHHEHGMGQGQPWAVADAPADFIASQIKGIVGVEISVTHLTGKVKASQNRSVADRAGVVAGLGVRNQPHDPAMALLVQRKT